MKWTFLPRRANLMAELHPTSKGSWLKAHHHHNQHNALVLTLSSAVTWCTALDSRLNYGPIMTESVEKYLFCGPNLIELSNCGSRSTPDFWCPELGSIYGGWGEKSWELRRLVCFTSTVFPMSHSCLHSSQFSAAKDAAKVTHNLSFLLRLPSRTFFALSKHEMLHFNDLCLGPALNFIALWSGFTILLQWYSMQVITGSMTSARKNLCPRVAVIAQEISNALNSLVSSPGLQPS